MNAGALVRDGAVSTPRAHRRAQARRPPGDVVDALHPHDARGEIRVEGVDDRLSTVARVHRCASLLECPGANERSGRGGRLVHECAETYGDLGLREGEVRDR